MGKTIRNKIDIKYTNRKDKIFVLCFCIVATILMVGILALEYFRQPSNEKIQNILKDDATILSTSFISNDVKTINDMMSERLKDNINDETIINDIVDLFSGVKIEDIEFDNENIIIQKDENKIVGKIEFVIHTGNDNYIGIIEDVIDDKDKDNIGIKYICIGTLDMKNTNIMDNYSNVDYGVILYKGKTKKN